MYFALNLQCTYEHIKTFTTYVLFLFPIKKNEKILIKIYKIEEKMW